MNSSLSLSFPDPVPLGTRVPHWAYLDTTVTSWSFLLDRSHLISSYRPPMTGIYWQHSLLAVRSFSNESQPFTHAWPCHRFTGSHWQRSHCPDLDQEEPIHCCG